MEHLMWLSATNLYHAKMIVDMPAGTRVELVREPQNQHDPNATMVIVRPEAFAAAGVKPFDAFGPAHLGYIPARRGPHNWAAALAPQLDAGETIEARIVARDGKIKIRIAIEGPAADKAFANLQPNEDHRHGC